MAAAYFVRQRRIVISHAVSKAHAEKTQVGQGGLD